MERIAIVGASVRAAAFSALRAGYAPLGLDLFADRDLRQRAAAIQAEGYPDAFQDELARHEVDAWMYTGGIENCPELVDRIAAIRRLWGNPGTTLRAVRNPFRCAQAFADAGIRCAPVKSGPEGLPCDGSWLEKPLRGSGGAGIRPWMGQRKKSPGRTPTHYFQQRIPGTPCSAVFVGAIGRAVLLGVTWQLVGEGWTGAAEFAYAGSIGPIELCPELESQWNRIGDCIAASFSLTGLFGVDAILDGQTVWPIEINPRYPASVEVLERGRGIQAMRFHAEACCEKQLPHVVPRAGGGLCGKAILYAPADGTLPPGFQVFAQAQMEPWPWPDLADVPEVGSLLRRRSPVATVFAEAADEASLRDVLASRLETLRRECFPGIRAIP
jgi:predicted ATP-grasp superfamily ATP-dependent carboligase